MEGTISRSLRTAHTTATSVASLSQEQLRGFGLTCVCYGLDHPLIVSHFEALHHCHQSCDLQVKACRSNEARCHRTCDHRPRNYQGPGTQSVTTSSPYSTSAPTVAPVTGPLVVLLAFAVHKFLDCENDDPPTLRIPEAVSHQPCRWEARSIPLDELTQTSHAADLERPQSGCATV